MSPAKKPEDKVQISLKEYEELKGASDKSREDHDRLLRLHAEFDNFKKRLEREKIEFIKYANQEILAEILEISDNFERAVASAERAKDYTLLHQGVDMILRQLHKFLNEQGVVKIETKGKIFNPEFHEAVMHVHSSEPEDTVIEELQSGYKFHDRLLRAAKVKVSKGESVKEEKSKEDISREGS